MPVNKALITLFLLFFTSLSLFAQSNSRTRIRIRPVLPYNHATLNAPPGMVYIRGGSTTIRYNQSSTDTNSIKKVSLTSFFIDKTEITNQQYRQFIEWVIDSIAVVKYLKDDKYFLSEKKDKEKGKDDAKTASTDTPAPVVAPVDSTQTTTLSTDTSKPAGGSGTAKDDEPITKRRIDWSKVNHKRIFESRDDEVKEKLKPLLDENGDIRKDAYVFSHTYLKAVNLANAKRTTTKYVTEPVTVYPNEKVWAEDMVNSQTELLVENYFKVTPYDDYPVVGVNWKQARAFSYWRSIMATAYAGMPEYMKYYHLTYSLPSEAQWVYAASGYFDMIASNTDTTGGDTISHVIPPVSSDSTATPHDSLYIATHTAPPPGASKKIDEPEVTGPIIVDSTPIHNDQKGLLANFKQDEGDYWEDGSALTLPVMAFAPNEFGLYNMEGNVAEWMLDAYSPSTFSFVSDLNPVLLYDADSADADAMKRKVIRGGSFISNAKALSPYNRDLELDNIAHCYVGFRCVMAAPEVLYQPVSTRKKRLQSTNLNSTVRRGGNIEDTRNIVKRKQ